MIKKINFAAVIVVWAVAGIGQTAQAATVVRESTLDLATLTLYQQVPYYLGGNGDNFLPVTMPLSNGDQFIWTVTFANGRALYNVANYNYTEIFGYFESSDDQTDKTTYSTFDFLDNNGQVISTSPVVESFSSNGYNVAITNSIISPSFIYPEEFFGFRWKMDPVTLSADSNWRLTVLTFQGFSLTPTVANSIPEPANWAMMIGGFSLVGAALRRRHSIKVALA